jgi:hypothetical protein
MNNTEIKAALEELHNPNVYSQAWVDCNSLLNLSLDTLLTHFQQWLWVEADQGFYSGPELAYYLELAKVEEYLTLKSLIYVD